MCVCGCVFVYGISMQETSQDPRLHNRLKWSQFLRNCQESKNLNQVETLRLWDLRYFEDSRWMSQKGAQGAHVCDIPWGFSRSFISRNKRRVRRMRATRMTCRRDSPTMYVTCMWHVIMWHMCVCAIMKNPSWKEIKAIQASWCWKFWINKVPCQGNQGNPAFPSRARPDGSSLSTSPPAASPPRVKTVLQINF